MNVIQSHIICICKYTLPFLSNKRNHLKTDTTSDVSHCSSVAQLDFDLTMFIHCNLAILILVLTLDDQVHTGEIFGGHEVKPHSRPYMVLLDRHMQDGRRAHCGGFLLNEDFVMTAAHCKAKSYKVFLGLHNIHSNEEVQHVMVPETNAFPQEAYNETTQRNDIMLLKLSTKAKINKNVTPIALAGRDDGSVPKSCRVLGWGTTEHSKFMSPKLLEVSVTLIDNKECTQQNKYCSEGVAGPDKGDSGGPLVCEDGRAYGVVSSRSDRDPVGSAIYTYTKIPDNRDWIDCIIKHNGKC